MAFYSKMPETKRKVLVLRYILRNDDFLLKRNEIRSDHLAYLRQYANETADQVEFKVAESLDRKSFYWCLNTSNEEMMKFMHNDPYYKHGFVQQWNIFSDTILERN